VARAAVKAAACGKPVVALSHISGGLDPTIRGILEGGNIPFLQGTREGLWAVHHLMKYAEFQRNRGKEEIAQEAVEFAAEKKEKG
jgi:acyl-CoA synthetase (NDP forming)